MGTVVTVCMLAGVIAGVLTPERELSALWARILARGVGAIVLAAGAWNIGWYWVRHPLEYWGLAALVSGLLMLWVSACLLAGDKLPPVVRRLNPVALLLLALAFLHYAVTIYNL